MTTIYDHKGFYEMSIPAAVFKAECLKLMDQVEKTGEPVVITKHGRAVAQLTPMPAESRSMFGYMKGAMKISGDVMAPISEEWSALSGDEDSLYAQPARTKSRRK
ncbi:MAG: type II toxin-antitoxin system Phd/YefM family antitoxin [Steroidobacteraceae bacterium]